MSVRQVVLDTETTGFDHKRGNRIIEIGAIELIDRKPTGKKLHFYINPEGQPIEPGAFAVHNISEEFLADKPLFRSIADEFITFIKGSELLIHNSDFDVGFLNMELAKVNKGTIWELCKVECTLKMAQSIYPKQRNSLDVLCGRLSVDNSARTAHGALLDAELLTEVYLLMTESAPPFVDDQVIADTPREPIVRVTRSGPGVILQSSEEQLAAHDAYIDVIEKKNKTTSVWRSPAAGSAPRP